MQNLPIHDVLTEILNTLNIACRVVLQAPPGAGKTTVVPLALLDQPWLENKQIILLEPRRLAARNAAARMAQLLNEKTGETIGYQVRQDSCYSHKTKILVVTEGILTRKLQSDPELKNIALVIFDEFHERSLDADLSLALCLQSQQVLNEKLKILVMSATLNTTGIADVLTDEIVTQVPVIQSEGRSYPVEIKYLEKLPAQSGQTLSAQQQLLTPLMSCLKQVIQQHTDNCLVFLPGVKEINLLARQLESYLSSSGINNIIVAPLHGNLSKQQQDQAISAPKAKLRKIVLATNIAETSLTIEGISCVIDSGLERVMQYNPASGMNRLKTQLISQDSAEQRCGRAGRLSAGVCYRLWTAQQQQRLVKHSIAEILHSDLSSLMLELSNWGTQDVSELQWIDVPPASASKEASELLLQLNAINKSGQITPHGRDMLKLATHPRLAHMILSAINLQQTYHACLLASLLTEKDIYLHNADKSIDIHDRINLLLQLQTRQQHHKFQGIDIPQCKRIIETADEFFKRLSSSLQNKISKDKADTSLSGVLLAYAYPERIAKQRHKNRPQYLLSNGKGCSIPDYLQHHLSEFLVVANLGFKHNEAQIYLAADITLNQIEEYFPDSIKHRQTVQWNDLLERVECKESVTIGKLVIQETLAGNNQLNTNKEDVEHCLMQAIQSRGISCLNWTPQAENLKQRVTFINHQLNIHNIKLSSKPLPDFSDETLNSTVNEWLKPHLQNINSIKQCQKIDTFALLTHLLDWEQQQTINKLAPEKITVPSGSAIKIDYADKTQAVLAVRLQEVFGLYETPSVLNGQVKLMMHLLSPARQPMQVTQDLTSFWKTTYLEVKKELRGKYKRHYWPDDPFTAQATSKTKKQMNR